MPDTTSRRSSVNPTQAIAVLIRKDLLIAKRYLLIGIPVFLSYGAMFLVTTRSYIVACGVFAAAAAIVPIWIDTMNRSDLLITGFPVTRTQIVLGRYLSVLGFIVAGSIAALLYGQLLDSVFPGADFDLGSSAVSVALSVISNYLILTLFLPFSFRYGLLKGFSLFAASLVAVAALVVMVSVMTHIVSGGGIEKYSAEAIFTFAARFAGYIKTPPGAVLFGAGGLVLVAISVLISIRLYTIRDF